MQSDERNDAPKGGVLRYRIIASAAILGAVAVGAYRSHARPLGAPPDVQPGGDGTASIRVVGQARPTLPSIAAQAPHHPAASGGPPSDARSAATAKRDRSIAEARSSGPDKIDLAAPAARVVGAWSKKVSHAGIPAQIGPVECYAKACFLTITQSSEGDVEQATRVITRTGEFMGWRAGKMRTGIIPRSDGQVEVTWFLYPPPAGQPPLVTPLPPDV